MFIRAKNCSICSNGRYKNAARSRHRLRAAGEDGS